jgi:predicted 3-demethylubiquinone-9 3-methyltransferase (glyoxalase superfamily)
MKTNLLAFLAHKTAPVLTLQQHLRALVASGLFALTAILVLTGSSFATPRVGPAEPEELTKVSLAKYESRWLAKRVRNYSFTLERTCFCAPRLGMAQFKVNRGKSQVITMSKGAPIAYSSMDRLFTGMRKTLKSGGRVAAIFDKTGIPSQVTLDPIIKATDDELYLTISKFKVLR